MTPSGPLRFSWDEAKAEANRAKHGVRFESARLVFDDPLHVTRQDRIENAETRWQTVGSAAGVLLLLVAHSWREDDEDVEHIRVISARRATRVERKVYEEQS